MLSTTYLNDCRTSSDGVIGDILVTASENNVGLAGKAFGDGDGVTTVNSSGWDKGGSSHGNESTIDLLAIGSLENIILE